MLVSAPVLADSTAATIGNTSYASLSAAIAAAGNGQNIVLQRDISNEGVIVNRSGIALTINLNGYTILENRTNTAGFTVRNGIVTLRNGAVRSTGTLSGDYVSAVKVHSGADVTLCDLVAASTEDNAVQVFGGNVKILSGTYTGFDDTIYADSENGVNAKVTITGGYFSVQSGSDTNFDDGCLVAAPGSNISIPDTAQVEPSNWASVPALAVRVLYFGDVAAGDWYRSYVYDLAAQGVINGRAPNVYEPANMVTRAEFAKILAAASGASLAGYTKASGFSDVGSGSWYLAYVNWAAEQGIADGRGNHQFVPDANITREEMAVMLQRYLVNIANKNGMDLPLAGSGKTFADSGKISSWAQKAVDVMVRAGIIDGYENNTFRPANAASRAETAKMTSVFLSSLTTD